MSAIKNHHRSHHTKLVLLVMLTTLVVGITTACAEKPENATESIPGAAVTFIDITEETTSICNHDPAQYLRAQKNDRPETEECYGIVFKSVSDVVYANCDTALKKEPNRAASSIGVLPYGDFVVCVGVSDAGWSRISHYGHELFVETRCLQAEMPAPEAKDRVATPSNTSFLYTKNTVNVRSGPGRNCVIIGLLYPGDVVESTGIEEDGWNQILYNGAPAYVYSEYLQPTNPNA